MVYSTYNELVTGAFVNQLITGGPHIVRMFVWLIVQRVSGMCSFPIVVMYMT